jgi:hypothetical protein
MAEIGTTADRWRRKHARKCLGIIDGVAFARHPRRVGATFIANTALGMMAARALCEGDARWPVALVTTTFGVGQIVGPTFAGVFHDGSFLVPSLIAVAGLLVGAVLVARLKAPGI